SITVGFILHKQTSYVIQILRPPPRVVHECDDFQEHQGSRRDHLQGEPWRKLNWLSRCEDVVESHQTHRELTDGPSNLLGLPKLGSSWNQIQDRSLHASPPVLAVCEADPALGKEPAFKCREFIQV